MGRRRKQMGDSPKEEAIVMLAERSKSMLLMSKLKDVYNSGSLAKVIIDNLGNVEARRESPPEQKK